MCASVHNLARRPDIHRVLVTQAERLPDDYVGLCLSSGTDSISMLFALLEAKKKVTAYSFFLEGRASTDVLGARSIAAQFGVGFVAVMLPSDIATLKLDCLRLKREFACESKTQFECVWPFLHTYPLVREPIIATGLGAGGHFCLSKKGMIHYRDRIQEFRDDFFARPAAGQMPQHELLAKHFNKTGWHPWMTSEMIEEFRGTTWSQLNRPRTKQALYDSFPQFARIKIRGHTNLQLGDSGIAHHFTKLLATDWNTTHARSVVSIYHRIT